MNNVVMIVFYSLLGAYMLGLGVFVLIRRHKNKKRVQKELSDYERQKENCAD